MRRTRITIDGVRCPVVQAGPVDAGEAAVFVHGSPGSTDDFLALVEASGRHGRAIAVDLPGFGRADTPEDWPATIEAYAEHLGRVLDVLEVDTAHLVLHDFGGPWGLRWLSDHPDRVGSVVLVNALGVPGYRWHRLARLWRTAGVGEVVLARAPRRLFHLVLREGNPTPIPAPHVDRMYDQLDEATRRTVLALYRHTEPWRLDALAARVAATAPRDLPTLVVWGEADPYLPIAGAERFRQVLPAARFVRIPEAGHWPFLSRPEVTDPVLVDWLAEHLAR